MMSGWAAFAGVGAVLYAAHKASDTFAAFRRQKQEDRRIEVAERILTIAYNVRRSIKEVRHPLHGPSDLDRAGEELKKQGFVIDVMDENEVNKLKTAQVVLNRVVAERATWDTVMEAMPTAKAIFGDAVEARLENLLKEVRQIRVAAAGYARDKGADPDRTQRYATLIWDMDDPEDKEADNPTNRLNREIGRLEAELLPVIRADHG